MAGDLADLATTYYALDQCSGLAELVFPGDSAEEVVAYAALFKVGTWLFARWAFSSAEEKVQRRFWRTVGGIKFGFAAWNMGQIAVADCGQASPRTARN